MSAMPPAYCPRCNIVFPSGFNLSGTANAYIADCLTQCDLCGGPAEIARGGTDDQGRGNFYFEARKILTSPSLRPLLIQINQTLIVAQQNGATSEQVAAALTKEVPGDTSGIVELLQKGQKMGLSLIAILSLLISAIDFIHKQQGDTTTNNTTINNLGLTQRGKNPDN